MLNSLKREDKELHKYDIDWYWHYAICNTFLMYAKMHLLDENVENIGQDVTGIIDILKRIFDTNKSYEVWSRSSNTTAKNTLFCHNFKAC